jgi:hypothetical protein
MKAGGDGVASGAETSVSNRESGGISARAAESVMALANQSAQSINISISTLIDNRRGWRQSVAGSMAKAAAAGGRQRGGSQ